MSTPEYWFNLRTRQVEEGRVSPAADRMGPYPTREAATAALDSAAERNEEVDEEEEAWRAAWDDEEDDGAQDEW